MYDNYSAIIEDFEDFIQEEKKKVKIYDNYQYGKYKGLIPKDKSKEYISTSINVDKKTVDIFREIVQEQHIPMYVAYTEALNDYIKKYTNID